MELAFKDYLLGIITLVVVYLLYKMMVVEKMTDDVLSDKNVHQIVKDTYQFDIQAIRNLGDLSKKIFDKDNGKLVFSHDVEIRGGKLVVSNDKGHERCIISGVGGKTAGGGAIESGKDIIVIPEQNGGNPGLVIGMDLMSGFTKGVSKMTGNVNVNGNITNTGELNATNLNVSGNMSTKNISTTGDITATGKGQFGVAKIGTGYGGGAEFTHKDGFNTSNYTIRSYGKDNAFINVPSGKAIYFRQNDEDKGVINTRDVNAKEFKILDSGNGYKGSVKAVSGLDGSIGGGSGIGMFSWNNNGIGVSDNGGSYSTWVKSKGNNYQWIRQN